MQVYLLPSLDEPELVIGHIVANVSGFGPLQPYLDDETVEEIWINEPSRVFIARAGRHELTPVILTAEQVRELVERMLSSSGRRLDISQPFVDAMLPGGHRLHVVLEGISRSFAAVNIRKSKGCTEPGSIGAICIYGLYDESDCFSDSRASELLGASSKTSTGAGSQSTCA